jgi:hypothetical protein
MTTTDEQVIDKAISCGFIDEATAQPTPPADAAPATGSWTPVDLGPYLDGLVQSVEPTMGLVRNDGVPLLYPGKEHAVIGEMEAGKTWFCLACVKAELLTGGHVVYLHFEEGEPSGTLDRLLDMDVPTAAIREQLHFVGPEHPGGSAEVADLVAVSPTLVVLDGVNEAMALHGWSIREEDGAARFRRYLVKPFTAVGVATLSADHVVKDTERRGRTALGSIHKVNGLSGALFLLETAEPFGRGARGRSHLSVLKDRPGYLRQHGRPDKSQRGKTYLGELVVDDTRPTGRQWLAVDLWPPPKDPRADPDEQSGNAGHAEADVHILGIVTDLHAAGFDANVTRVKSRSSYGTDKTIQSLERLVLDGHLTEISGPRRARIFTLTGPDDAAAEQSS